jgi:hypothetical protein
MSQLVGDIKNSGDTGSGDQIVLAAPILSKLDELVGIYDDAIALVQVTAIAKLNCTRTKTIYNGIVGSLCDTFAPQFALSITMFAVMGKPPPTSYILDSVIFELMICHPLFRVMYSILYDAWCMLWYTRI